MSVNSALNNVQMLTNTIGKAADIVTRTAQDLGAGNGFTELFMDKLFPASFRGVPFGVLGGESRFGRRNVVHEYPFRDKVWVEDLGMLARRINISGFLVGDDVIAQRERLIAACEKSGDALLMHPSYGQLIGTMLGALSIQERWDRGRVFEFSFTFIESGDREFPTVESATSDAVDAAAVVADGAASADFAKATAAALKKGAAVVKVAVDSAAAWSRTAQKLTNDATNLANMVSTLQGNFGRFSAGRNRGAFGADNTAQVVGTVAGLIAKGSVARANVTSAVNTLTTIAGKLGL